MSKPKTIMTKFILDLTSDQLKKIEPLLVRRWNEKGMILGSVQMRDGKNELRLEFIEREKAVQIIELAQAIEGEKSDVNS